MTDTLTSQPLAATPETTTPLEAVPLSGTFDPTTVGTSTPGSPLRAPPPKPASETANAFLAAYANQVYQQRLQAPQPAPVTKPVTQHVANLVTASLKLGLETMPQTAGQWAKLIDKYSTPRNLTALNSQVTVAETEGPPTGYKWTTTHQYFVATGAAGKATPVPVQSPATNTAGTASFLWAIRQHESGQTYTVHNYGPTGASGAYQYIFTTWHSEAKDAGLGQYATKPAWEAPPAVQDAVAEYNAGRLYSEYHTWSDAAQAWYTPSHIGSSAVPAPTAGNTEGEATYGRTVVGLMAQAPAQDRTSPTAGTTNNVVNIARTQLGVPYQWGGESPGKNFDCSGLVQWTYSQAGVTLPRVAQTQYNATTKLPAKAVLEPGDLLFFGTGPTGISHVGIYVGTGQMIDAPETGQDVSYSEVFPNLKGAPPGSVPGKSSWLDYVGATRPTDPTGASVAPRPTAGSYPYVPTGKVPAASTVTISQRVYRQMRAMQ